MPPDPTAPPVVAVVVASDPGAWFEECLAALGAQDHPNLSVLVVDAGEEDLSPRVAACLPGAHVRRTGRRLPFGAAANEALGAVEGAAYLLICHDDVAPAPDAVSQLAAEAARSNAGLVSPKLVAWEDPDRLLAVGAAADRVGSVLGPVEPGELDQEQHDTPRDVFVAPGAAVLVRADLFAELGGYDPDVPDLGEDLNLSWRAQLAGARVVVAPAARVRHLAATARALRPGPDRRRAAAEAERHRWLTLLGCSSAASLLWLGPMAVLFALGEAVTALLAGRPGWAADTLAAPAGALAHPGRLRAARRRVRGVRHVPDRAVRRRQLPGNARLRAWLRHRLDRRDAGPAWAPDPPGGAWASDPDPLTGQEDAAGGAPALDVSPPAGDATGWQLPVLTAAIVAVVLAAGSRTLLTHGLPDVGSLPPAGGGPGAWWSAWWSSWQPAGLGRSAAGPPGAAVLGLIASVLGASVPAMRHVVVLAPLALGPLGAWRLARPWGPPAARAVAAVAYAAVPLAYDAMAVGDWRGLVAVAALPWVVAAIGRRSDALPHPSTSWRQAAWRLPALGLLVALAASCSPALLLVVPVTAAGLAAGSVLCGEVAVAARTLITGVAAAALAAVLLLPWSAGFLAHPADLLGPALVAGPRTAGGLLRFAVGPVGTGPLGWGLVVAAALALLVGRSWRLAWAVRLWALAIVSFGWAWLGAAGTIPAPPPSVTLAPAAVGLAGAAALGAVAFVQDLPGYRFGWRQAASAAAALGLALACLPPLGAALGGSWGQPSAGPDTALASLDAAPGAPYRVLWVGAPGALPLASLPLQPGVAWATSWDGMPGPADGWGTGAAGGSRLVAGALLDAAGGLTSHLGRLLAPLGIRYVVVPFADGPAGSGAAPEPAPGGVLAALERQTDLVPLVLDPAYRVYAVPDALPARAALTPAAAASAAADTTERAVDRTAVGGATAVLPGGPGRVRGPLPAGPVYLSVTPQRGWRLTVAGHAVALRPAFAGAGLLGEVPAAGTARVGAPAAPGVRAGDAAEAALWALGAAAVLAERRRRSRPGAEPAVVEAEWFAPHPPATRRVPAPVAGPLDEEAWAGA